MRPGVKMLTSLLLALCLSQIASLTLEHALFAIWAMAQVVFEGHASESTA